MTRRGEVQAVPERAKLGLKNPPRSSDDQIGRPQAAGDHPVSASSAEEPLDAPRTQQGSAVQPAVPAETSTAFRE
jgi:hypothetical protein